MIKPIKKFILSMTFIFALMTCNTASVVAAPEERKDFQDFVDLSSECFVLPAPEIEEPVVIPAVEIEPIVEEVPEPELPLTQEEIDLIALITMAEAEGEPEEGKRLVIDTILNRVDSEHFPDTVHDVIYQKNQYSCVWSSRLSRCEVRDDIVQLVVEELEHRTNSEVVFFRTLHYHTFGVPQLKVGNHYFSSYD